MRLIISILLNGALVFFLAEVLSGVYVDGYLTAVITGIVLGVVNFLIRPLVTILTLPISILTLGIFLLVINGAMVLLADRLVEGFQVDGLMWAIIFSILLALLNSILGNSKSKKDH